MRSPLYSFSLIFFSISFLLINTACDRQYKEEASIKAISYVKSISDVKLEGEVRFTQPDENVHIKIEIEGLVPNKIYAFHIHETGNCSNRGKAAGGHFNPLDHQHAGLNQKMSHAGDLGNIQANERGIVNKIIRTDKISLKDKSKTFIIGRAVVLHAGVDDFVSQPSGNAGERIGCGIIKNGSELLAQSH